LSFSVRCVLAFGFDLDFDFGFGSDRGVPTGAGAGTTGVSATGTAVAAKTGETLGVSKSPISISPAARDDRMKLAAVVKEVGAFCGIGAALLPLRNAGFFGGFSRTSRRDGKSGEEDMRIAD
jgi:hypothetical protein